MTNDIPFPTPRPYLRREKTAEPPTEQDIRDYLDALNRADQAYHGAAGREEKDRNDLAFNNNYNWFTRHKIAIHQVNGTWILSEKAGTKH